MTSTDDTRHGTSEPYRSDELAPLDTDRTEAAHDDTHGTGGPAHRAETHDTGSAASSREDYDAEAVRSHGSLEDEHSPQVGTEDALLTDAEKVRARGIDQI